MLHKLIKNPLECNPYLYPDTGQSPNNKAGARADKQIVLLAADNKFTVIKLARAALIKGHNIKGGHNKQTTLRCYC